MFGPSPAETCVRASSALGHRPCGLVRFTGPLEVEIRDRFLGHLTDSGHDEDAGLETRVAGRLMVMDWLDDDGFVKAEVDFDQVREMFMGWLPLC